MWDSRLANENLDQHPLDQDAPPSVVIAPHSALGKELRKWEQHITHLTPAGTRPGNPYVYRPFPKMLYKAEKHPQSGQPVCVMANPHPWHYASADELQHAQNMQASWNTNHQRIARDEGEEALAKGQGWANSPAEALELFERSRIDISRVAAEANYTAARMGDQAQREWKEAADATADHVVDVQGKKRGRPAKVVTA